MLSSGTLLIPVRGFISFSWNLSWLSVSLLDSGSSSTASHEDFELQRLTMIPGGVECCSLLKPYFKSSKPHGMQDLVFLPADELVCSIFGSNR